ncbi:transcription factor Sp2-like isoform X1 [Cynoglossus semilaevis]|nr:transcription factor Sp2-like isoform X1 [Cynoglossus semilaevis]
MATTVAVSPSEYLQPSTSPTQLEDETHGPQTATKASQDPQPSPLALLAATCSKIGPPAAQAPVSTPVPPQPRRLLPIKPAPIAPAPPKNLGFLSPKGNVILGPAPHGNPIVLTIQASPARTNTAAPANIQYQMVPQIQGTQTIQVMPQGGQIQLIPGTNQAIITTPMTVPVPAAATAPITPPKTVTIKPSPKSRKPNNSTANIVQLPSGCLTLPLNVATGEVGGTQIITETAAATSSNSGKGKRGRKKKVVLSTLPQLPPPAQAASPPPEQMETYLIDTGDNIIQAGNNLLIVQSPGQPAVVQQVQLMPPKQDSQVVQIPQQALKVVQAASATLPPVPQRQSAPSNLQVTTSEQSPTQLFFKSGLGEWSSVLLQDSVSSTTTATTTSASITTSPPTVTKKTPTGGKKERTLAKIAPAGGMITLNTSQLPTPAQGVQTISINGVQVQGVPVTITNAGGQQHLTVQTMHGGGLQLAAAQGQPAIQVDQALTLELPSQPGEKKRRMACTCPNCKDADKRFVSRCLSRDFSSCIQSCDVD